MNDPLQRIEHCKRQIELLIDNHPDCPRWASAEVDRLIVEIEDLSTQPSNADP